MPTARQMRLLEATEGESGVGAEGFVAGGAGAETRHCGAGSVDIFGEDRRFEAVDGRGGDWIDFVVPG